jgi:hypothetical protein
LNASVDHLHCRLEARQQRERIATWPHQIARDVDLQRVAAGGETFDGPGGGFLITWVQRAPTRRATTGTGLPIATEGSVAAMRSTVARWKANEPCTPSSRAFEPAGAPFATTSFASKNWLR